MKKFAITFIILIICLTVIGTCYALYRYQSKDIDVDLYTENSVSLKITDSNGAELTLSTNDLNPNNPFIKTIKLSHNKIDTTVVDEKGNFTIELSGDKDLIPYIDVTATLLDDLLDTTSTIYDLTELQKGVSFNLSSEINLSLKVSLKEMSLDEYISIAQKKVYINLQWRYENTSSNITPPADEIESGYYIIGDFSDWEINSNAYKLEEINNESYKAKLENFSEEDTYNFRVVKYDASTKEITKLTANTEYISGTKQGEDNTIQMIFPSSVFNIYVNSNEEYLITAEPIEL